jgi:dihydrolipoamide dehydrogenase
MENNFDVIVIGGGPGGYVCAIRASQLGLKTACVESRGTLGGTCLNVGCIPSKSLLNLSENYHKAKKQFGQQGIEISNLKLNIDKMMSNKTKSVQVLTKGIEFLFKKNKVTYLKGKGIMSSKNEVEVDENGKKKLYKGKNIVIATGSAPTSLPGITIDEKNILSSTGALSLSKVPDHLVVIGGGYIGLEMGSVWSRLGSKVTVIEYLDFITPGMDREISNEFLL